MNTVLDQIKTWYNAAKPNPNIFDVCTQLGCHFEEVAEMMNTLGLTDACYHTEVLANGFKRHEPFALEAVNFVLSDDERKGQLLDDLADQAVTGQCSAESMRMNFIGYLEEVANSNDSKFTDEGYPLFDENGKIIKGPNYFKANPLPYVGTWKGD